MTLTDYALALECALFAVWTARANAFGPEGALRRWLVLFFAASAAAPALGGTVHGFFPDPASFAHRALWTATLLAIGVAALGAAGVAAGLLFAPDARRRLRRAALLLFVLYAGVVLGFERRFAVAIAAYLPAALLLGAAFAGLAARTRSWNAGLGVAGVGLTLIAAVVQQQGIGLHPHHFDHNALYHVIQGVAFACLFVAGRSALTRAGGGSHVDTA